MSDEELFTTKMSKATRKIHTLSDRLINAKLLFALRSNKVWVEGLLIFYEVFKFLEEAMKNKSNKNLNKLYFEEIQRTKAFEKELDYYLGEDWKKNYEIRDSVKNYLEHLEYLQLTDSDLLLAYVYHLYMGLLSGGQILRKKRELQTRISVGLGNTSKDAVTDFSGTNISELKSRLKNKMNEIANSFDEKKKKLLIEESKIVFELNNSIVRSIKEIDGYRFTSYVIFVSFIVLVIATIWFVKIKFGFLM